jgi:hypothetical protein
MHRCLTAGEDDARRIATKQSHHLKEPSGTGQPPGMWRQPSQTCDSREVTRPLPVPVRIVIAGLANSWYRILRWSRAIGHLRVISLDRRSPYLYG